MKISKMRWYAWFVLAAIVIAGLVPGFMLLHSGKPTRAHAAGSTTPTITPSTTVVRAFQALKITAQGFAPNETVEVYFYYDPNFPPDGFLPCDGNGNCAGTVYASDLTLAGPYMLTGVGNVSGLQAQTAITLIAGVQLSPREGSQGTSIQVTGSCFALNETVKIYWGGANGTFLGTASTDNIGGNWYFTFNAPNGLTAGKYAIVAVRSHQKPGDVVAWFQYDTPHMQSSPGIRSGQVVQVKVKGFAPSEQVTISWNANGGQILNTFTVGANGTGLTVFTPPTALPGSYTLTAVGQSSGIQATSSLLIGPGIQINPSSGSPGSTITVSGGGYQPNETVQVYFDKKSNGVTTTTTDSAGTFSASLTLPRILTPGNSYHVFAQNTAGSERAQALFTYNGPSVGIGIQIPVYGEQNDVNGSGYTANETVTIYWEYGLAGQLVLGTVTADNNGNFLYPFKTPSEPNLSSLKIAAIGSFSKLMATVAVFPNPFAYIQPSSGPTGTQVTMNGGGLGANETVSATLQGIQGTPVVTTTTDSTGAFTLTYTMPLSLNDTDYTLVATGSTSGVNVVGFFIVTPILAITPTTGISHTPITVTGQSFNPDDTLTILWNDPSNDTNITLATVTSSSTGAFSVTVNAPGKLVKGNTYYIMVNGSNIPYPWPQAAFVAQ